MSPVNVENKSATQERIEKAVDRLTDEQIRKIALKTRQYEDIKESSPISVYSPNPVQKEYNQSEAKYNFLFGGNMSGKTYNICFKLACHLLECDPSGTTPDEMYAKKPAYAHKPKVMWFASVNTTKAKSIFEQDLKPLLPRGSYHPTRNFDSQTNTFTMLNGNKLKLMSYEAPIEAWQSEAVDAIGLDEQPPWLHFKEAMSRVNRKGGVIYCAMTPLYANSAWTYRQVYRGRLKNCAWWMMDLLDNTHLTEEQIQSQIDSFGGTDEEASRIHGEFQIRAGVIHPLFEEERHIIAPFQIDLRMRNYYEFARVIDMHRRSPNVCQWFMFERRKRPVANGMLPPSMPQEGPFVLQFAELSVPAGYIQQFADGIKKIDSGLRHSFTIIDSPDSLDEIKKGTALVSELGSHGIHGQRADRAHGPAVQRYNEYLEYGKYRIFSNNRETIASIEDHIWDNYKGARVDEVNPKEDWVHKDDHQVRNTHFMIMRMPIINLARAEARNRFLTKYRGRDVVDITGRNVRGNYMAV